LLNRSKMIEQKNSRSSGSAFIYILIAIALLAALTASFMRPGSQQTTAQGSFKAVSSLKSQIDFVRSAIQECVLTYPSGEAGIDGMYRQYPINPSSSYYDDVVLPAEDDSVAFVRCPGNPGNSKNHAEIFSGASGRFMPPPPDLFEPWIYYNGADGVFFFTRTNKTDGFLGTALQKLDDDFSECQADVIDASNAQRELTSTAASDDPKCPSGSVCFRVWLIIQPSAVYTGDTDGEETAVPCP
jgi:hypothetical protein